MVFFIVRNGIVKLAVALALGAVVPISLIVIKVADYIVDLGPESGDGGGDVVAKGTPEEVSTVKGSHTGKYLRKVLATKTGA